jgi:hypothetical protein
VRWLCVALLVAAAQSGEQWKVPAHPDPGAILQEAQEDTRQGRYALALAKHLWFHHEALKIDKSFSGVRLSFALSYWFKLANQYPPALDALVKTRDEALEALLRGDGTKGFQDFQDLEAINHTLGKSAQTVEVFSRLTEEQPEVAESVFEVAEPALIRAKQYALCGKYLKPRQAWLSARQLYEMDKLHSGDRRDPEDTDFLEKSFTNEVSTLVALLVVNERKAEAKAIAEEAKHFWDSPPFHAALDAALLGAVPEPWP